MQKLEPIDLTEPICDNEILYCTRTYHKNSSHAPDRRRGTTSTCPQCRYPQYCGCITCLKKVPEGYLPYHWTEDGEHITCANCGLTMHVDQWLDEEARQIRGPRS